MRFPEEWLFRCDVTLWVQAGRGDKEEGWWIHECREKDGDGFKRWGKIGLSMKSELVVDVARK